METQLVLKKIEGLAAMLQSLLPLKPEYNKKLEDKFRLEFNYHSNHLEGNTLTYGKTKLLLFFDQTSGDHTMREYEEMKAHDAAYYYIKQIANDPERLLNERIIRELHEIILVRPFWKEAITPDGQTTKREIRVGEYKKQPNSVRLPNGELFEYKSPEATPAAMYDLLNWFHEEIRKKELHPIVLGALLHYKFVCIHPFDDGNGRLSRLLLNYVLLKHQLPPIIIKSDDKKNYLAALNKADSGDMDAFINYVLHQSVWSLELSIKAAKGESIEELNDIDKEIDLWKKEQKAKKAKTPFSPDKVYPIYYESLRPIFFQILNTLKENFIEFYPLIDVSLYTDPYMLGRSIELFDTEINALKGESIRQENIIKKIKANYTLRNSFLPEKQHLSIFFEIIVQFKPILYDITFNGKIINKPYDAYLTEAEKTEIANTCVKHIFHEIKIKHEGEHS